MDTQLFIDGTWREAADGARFAVHEPATGDELARVADAGVAEGVAALAAAHAAQPGWAATAPRQRSEVLRRAFELMVARSDALAELIVRENGKPIAEARGEVGYAAEFFRWFAEEAVRLDGRIATAPGGANKMIVLHQPIGVALLVTPWNFPAAMATRKIGPALAAGCAVVLKPASETPLTALAVAALLAEAGVPPGVVNVVPTTRNAEVVAALMRDERLRKLSFTGSTEVGKLLLTQAAQRVLRCSMELGGNAPFLVFADADLDAAVQGALLAKLRHNGEACTAANRFYVERPVLEAFAEKLSAAFAGLKLGNGLDPSVRIGPLVDAATRDKVTRLVDAAVAAGARVRCGGAAPSGAGFFYPATVLDRVATDSPILAEEIFGPVAPLVAFDSEAEAVRLANASQHGLVSYLYSGDLGRGLRLAEALEAGMVGVNRGLVSDPAAPFGGVKQSGLGREGGHEGLLEYAETKYVAVAW
ncbi:MAG: NAD-dependent succinate-semialdehyde dehydrogenase [Deltaproteobacteria bacterium]|nr:NAD-dependent succinate-semialdehyde dehydrogenase [Deltaproteobacteria bacterium]